MRFLGPRYAGRRLSGVSWDEWVGPDRIRPYQPTLFAEGTKVQVHWETDRKWYPATILKAWYGMHFIRYDGCDASWDEWIGPGAIRKRENCLGVGPVSTSHPVPAAHISGPVRNVEADLGIRLEHIVRTPILVSGPAVFTILGADSQITLVGTRE